MAEPMKDSYAQNVLDVVCNERQAKQKNLEIAALLYIIASNLWVPDI